MCRAQRDDALVPEESESHDDTRLPGVAQDDGRLAIDLGELGLEGIREETVRAHGEARHRASAGQWTCGGAVHGRKRCARETGEPCTL